MEQKGTLTDVDYDDTVYTVTVEVTDNHDRTVSAEIVNIQKMCIRDRKVDRPGYQVR